MAAFGQSVASPSTERVLQVLESAGEVDLRLRSTAGILGNISKRSETRSATPPQILLGRTF